MKNKLFMTESDSSFFKNYFPTIIVMIFIVGLAVGFAGGSETSNADSCKQQICVKDGNNNPVVNRLVTVKNSSGVVVATWYTGIDGCFPPPGLPNFNTGENHTITVCCAECPTNPVNFTACASSTITVTACD